MTKEERRGYRYPPPSSENSPRLRCLPIVIPVASLMLLLVTPAVANIAGEDVAISETFTQTGFAADPTVTISSPALFFDLGQQPNSLGAGADLETEIFLITTSRLRLVVNRNPDGVFDRSQAQSIVESDDHSTLSVESALLDTDAVTPRFLVSALSSTGETVPDEPWTGPLLGCILAVIGFSFYARKRMRSH